MNDSACFSSVQQMVGSGRVRDHRMGRYLLLKRFLSQFQFHLNPKKVDQSSLLINCPTDLNPCPFYCSSMKANLFKRTKCLLLLLLFCFVVKETPYSLSCFRPYQKKKEERNFQTTVSQASMGLRSVLKISEKKYPYLDRSLGTSEEKALCT